MWVLTSQYSGWVECSIPLRGLGAAAPSSVMFKVRFFFFFLVFVSNIQKIRTSHSQEFGEDYIKWKGFTFTKEMFMASMGTWCSSVLFEREAREIQLWIVECWRITSQGNTHTYTHTYTHTHWYHRYQRTTPKNNGSSREGNQKERPNMDPWTRWMILIFKQSSFWLVCHYYMKVILSWIGDF